MKAPDMQNSRTGLEIAVIGMNCRFPGARNLDEYWENLKNGIESIAFFSDQELNGAGIDKKTFEEPGFINAAANLEDIEYFDCSFFGYTPMEAEIMDPQMRIFHECVWEVLEQAGYNPFTYDRLIGLYAGACANFFWEARVELSGKSAVFGWFPSRQLNDKDFMATRIAHKLNLKGPAITLDTACSTTLVAIHLACQGLLNWECDMALAGGVNVTLVETNGYRYQEGMLHSPDGHCRAFDGRAKGTAFGNGVGVVLLKRLEEAVEDGDFIYAVIKGSCINNDGSSKPGYTAPSIEGQASVIRTAHKMAEVEPESISYVETHGTGTVLGDPVEIEGLRLAFNTRERQFCGIGSVKTNFGHLEIAAGVAGFIKTVLALNQRLIPPSLHFEIPNQKIDFENSPFYVVTRLTKWNLHSSMPLRAGVSSFGIGGTNAHVILEEWSGDHSSDAERKAQSAEQKVSSANPVGTNRVFARESEHGPGDVGENFSPTHRLILLSAKSETALEKMTRNLVKFFRQNPGTNLADAAFTLQVGRKVHRCRRMVVCSGIEDVVELLSSPDSGKVKSYVSPEDNRPLVFMFSGIGSQYVNMGRDLYQGVGVFREEMDRCFEILKSFIDYDIKTILYPGMPDRTSRRGRNIDHPEVTQLVLFIFEYVLARLLMSWGIKPASMIGYSFGEYVAACIAEVFSLEDGLKLVVERGRLVEKVPHGGMLSVPLPLEELKPLLENRGDLSVGIDNGPSCIVSGYEEALKGFESEMKDRKLVCMRVRAARGLHSVMMERILDDFADVLTTIRLNKSKIPFISNVTGSWIREDEAADVGYWVRHLRNMVRFADGMRELRRGSSSLLVEIGPGRDISTLALRDMEDEGDKGHQVLNMVRPSRQQVSDVYLLLSRLGHLWMFGQSIDWQGFYRGEQRQRIILPSYPFERQRCWIDANSSISKALLEPEELQLHKKTDIADWFYVPQWTRTVLTAGQEQGNSRQACCLLFTNSGSLASRLMEKLQEEGSPVISVGVGPGFQQVGQREYRINPAHFDDYNVLIRELGKSTRHPDHIVNLWNVEKRTCNQADRDWDDGSQYLGFFSLIFLAKAIGTHHISNELQIDVITTNLQEVSGGEILSPYKATLLGAIKVLPQEYANIRCRCIDVEVPEPGTRHEAELVNQLVRELRIQSSGSVVAYRNNYRWLQAFAPLRLEDIPPEIPKLRKSGVYLIAGGLGNLGFSFSQHLVKKLRAKLILIGRSPLPPRSQWHRWLAVHQESDPISRKILRVKALLEMGGKVLVFGADIADKQRMRRVLARSEKAFGPVNGVIHAAGDMGSLISPIQDLTEEACRRQFHSKVQGLRVLGELFKDKELDFCLLTSSLSPILGGLGFAAYSAANSYMDAYVYKYNRSNSMKWMSVNWGDWQAEKISGTASSPLAELEMTAEEGIKTFDRILFHCDFNQVVVSAGDLQRRIDQWVTFKYMEEWAHTTGKKPSALHERLNLMTPYTAPRSRLEQDMTDIWQELFGFDRIGIKDDFFELKGDSLKAVILLSKIHKRLGIEVPITTFFDQPNIEQLCRYIEEDGKIGGKYGYESVRPVEEKDYYVVSPAQRRIYLFQQANEKSIVYNESKSILLNGHIRPQKLQHTAAVLISRHESLRTVFEVADGMLVQRIIPAADASIEIEYYDLRAGGEKGKVEEILRHFIRPFDLSRAPLLRAVLIDLAESRCLLILDMHHIAVDGNSADILLGEFEALFRGEQLQPLQFRYKDYSEWQNRRQEEENSRMNQQKEYWLKQFEGEIPVLTIPTDYPRHGLQRFAGDSISFAFGSAETAALKKLAADEEATLFMVLLALFNILFYKLSSQEDIVLGTVTAGFGKLEFRPVIGMFVNTLALRNYPSPEKDFCRFLKEVKQRTLHAFENQDYPFDDLAAELQLSGDKSRNPLFDVMFVLGNITAAGENGDRESVETSISPVVKHRFGADSGVTKFDIHILAGDAGSRLSFTFQYSTTLFKRETIQRFINYFKELVSQVIHDREKKLKDFTISHDLVQAKLEAAREDFENFAF